jgi:hypothetical protein
MTELPPDHDADVRPDPTADTQVHIPEFKREAGSVPWLGIAVILILAVAGVCLLGFAVVYGQSESENRAINSTVVSVLAFTHTPLPTRQATSTLVPTVTPAVSTDTPLPITDTPGVTFTDTPLPPAATNTRPVQPTQPIVVPTDTPVPPTNPPAPVGANGVIGELTLCNPEKPSFAANIERICFREKIVNTTGAPVPYGVLGVQITGLDGAPSSFHSSWQGALSIGPGCTGPTDVCGGPWEDGTYLATPGSYRLQLSMCFSDINSCLGGTGNWATLTSGVNVTVISWTPSP